MKYGFFSGQGFQPRPQHKEFQAVDLENAWPLIGNEVSNVGAP